MSEDYQAPSGAGHPITPPPPELVEQLRSEAPHGIRDAGAPRERHLIAAAYRAGADQELEACCEYMQHEDFHGFARELRAARRPKPPSLSEPALEALDRMDQFPTAEDQYIIRRALERLQELEGNG